MLQNIGEKIEIAVGHRPALRRIIEHSLNSRSRASAKGVADAISCQPLAQLVSVAGLHRGHVESGEPLWLRHIVRSRTLRSAGATVTCRERLSKVGDVTGTSCGTTFAA